MRTATICGALATLAFSATVLAQAPMHGGAMDKPMPANVNDSRQVIPLTLQEQALVAVEMRQMLASVQGVVDGVARGDLKAVLDAASKSGMAMMQDVPSQIRAKFPPPFRQFGMAAHQAFDRIVAETKSVKDPAPVLKLLAESVQNCNACHATYRFEAPK